MTTLADLDLTRLEALAEKATPAPWAVDEMPGFEHHVRTSGTASAIPSTGEPVADTALDADAEFIAAMRNAAPSLLAAARALAELVRLKDGPRDDAYRAAKEAAWSAARAALGGAE